MTALATAQGRPGRLPAAAAAATALIWPLLFGAFFLVSQVLILPLRELFGFHAWQAWLLFAFDAWIARRMIRRLAARIAGDTLLTRTLAFGGWLWAITPYLTLMLLFALSGAD